MSDIFRNIKESIETEMPKISQKPSEVSNTQPKPSTSKSDDKLTSTKEGTSKSNSSKISCKSSTRTSTQESMEKLSEIMTSGFQNLQRMFEGFMTAAEDEEIEEMEVNDTTLHADVSDETDLFHEVSSQLSSSDKRGDDVLQSLATLTDVLLKRKIESSEKEKYDKYLIPKNIDSINTPQINKPIWGNLSHSTKRNDVNLQLIQKDFLHSSLPIISVMQKLNSAKDDLSALDVKDLIQNLSDGLAFLGSANVKMVQHRRSCVRKELPINMQSLCRDSVEFSGSNLFGNDLSADIREVTELNKISHQLRGGVARRVKGRGGFRGAARGTGIQSFKFRGGRIMKRFGRSRGLPTKMRTAPLNLERPFRQ